VKVAGKITLIEVFLLLMAAVFLTGVAVQVLQAARAAEGEPYVITTGRTAADPVTPPVPEDTKPLDLNTATLEQLQTLPGVGPVLAQRIVDLRTERGVFSSVEELLEVKGIGAATLEQLRSYVIIESASSAEQPNSQEANE